MKLQSVAAIVLGTAALAATTAHYLTLTYHSIGVHDMSGKSAERLTEPLYISGNDPEQKAYYLLPAGTVLYPDVSFAEGHTRYAVYFNFKGRFESENADPKVISPLWLFNIEKDDVTRLMQQYPLTKNDLVKILKARKITRDELAQIVREWTD